MKYQIIPNLSIDNTKLLGMLENTNYYRKPIERLKYQREEDLLEFQYQYTTTYEILITKDDVKFFIGFDDNTKDNFDTELNICWKHATFKKSRFVYIGEHTKELELSEHYFLSLKTDLRGQFPLSNILETQNILRDKEDICIRFELTPLSPTWYREVDACIEQFKKDSKVATKSKLDVRTVANNVVSGALNVVYEGLDFINYFVDTDNKVLREYPEDGRYANVIRNGLSNDTLQKPRYSAYKTRMTVSLNSKRSNILYANIVRSFNSMSGDNSFNIVNKSNYKNILSTKELAQIMQMPTKEYQSLYKINNVDTREVEVPRKVLKGHIPIGEATIRGITYKTYWNEDKNVLPLPKIVIGPMGSGKSEYTKNFVVNAAKNDSVIVFDYIKDCELSNDIAASIKDCIKIDLSKLENLNGLGYPEVKTPSDSWGKLKKANMLSRQVEYLINSLSDEPLSPRMSRYLDAAAKIVFIHEESKISDVIDVLASWEVRGDFIRRSKGILNDNDTEIVDLLSLHERDKDGKIIGTRETKIEGILDRISIMNKDIFLRKMMRSPVNLSEDFAKYMNEGKTILIQLPEHTFTNKQVKDTIVTYYMSRIWLAALQRGSDKICHIVTDEIHQVPTAAKLVSDVITEGRKFGIGFYFTIHYLKQFRQLESAIRSAGASYIFLAGTEKENLTALEDELKPFTIADGLNLKPFHSLNIVNIGNQYAKYISKLPKPI